MTLTNKRDRQMLTTDLMFGFFGIAGLFILAHRGFVSAPESPVSNSPLLLAGGLVGLAAAVTLLQIKFADIERRCNEDYRWQLMARSAFIAGMTVVLFAGLTEDFLLGRWLGQTSGNTLLGVLIGSWALAYFIARLKGASQ